MEANVRRGAGPEHSARTRIAAAQRTDPKRVSALNGGFGSGYELRDGNHCSAEEGTAAMSRRGKREKNLDDLIADSRKLREQLRLSLLNLNQFTGRLQEQVETFIQEEQANDDKR
jgi:hypothetical protein